MWVATKWDFFLGGGACLGQSRLGIVSGGGVYSNLNVFGARLIHIS